MYCTYIAERMLSTMVVVVMVVVAGAEARLLCNVTNITDTTAYSLNKVIDV
jgi:hypothetical protein